MVKTLRWLIVFVGAAIVTYLILSTALERANRNTQNEPRPTQRSRPSASGSSGHL